MRKTVATIAILAAATAGLAGCKDPSSPDSSGKVRHVKIWISPGTTTVTSQYYGLWHAVTDTPGGGATSACQWSIHKNGKLQQSGGWKDSMLVGPSARGGTITVGAACYKLAK